MENFGGVFPDTYKELLAQPGIGDYTAGAILSIAMGQTVPAVDGNVLRVVSRVAGYGGDITDPKSRKQLRDAVESILPDGHAGEFNQAMMDLGATVCLPHGTPLCGKCPAGHFCAAHRECRESQLPVRGKRKEKRVEHLTVFILRRGDTVALRKRPESGLLAGLWEYPFVSGALTEAKAAEQVASWGLVPHRWGKKLSAKHDFTHIRWEMTGYFLEVEGGGPTDWIWCDPAERQKKAIPSAFEKLVKETE